MFKYTKRLLFDIRFWCQECKLRRKEYKEFERIEDEEWRHPMAGFGYYQTMKRNRAERKRLQSELRHSDKTLAQLADEMNFPNTSFLCKYFKRLTTLSPLAYRNGR